MRIDNVKKAPTWVRSAALSGGNSTDSVKAADLRIENAMRPEVEEPAIIHPFNTSSVKIRNNGMIDCFVATNQGIRIDPHSKTVNIIANGQKEHLGYFRAWIDVDAEWYANSHYLFKSMDSSFNVDVKTDINHTCERDRNSKIGKNETIKIGINQDEEIGNNQSTKIGGNQKITIAGNLDITVGGNINMTASGNIRLKGSNIYHN